MWKTAAAAFAGSYLYSDWRNSLSACRLAARGGTPVGRVASAARMPARSGDAGNAGHWRGATTKPEPRGAATLWAARIWRAASREFRHGLLEIDRSSRTWQFPIFPIRCESF